MISEQYLPKLQIEKINYFMNDFVPPLLTSAMLLSEDEAAVRFLFMNLAMIG